MCLRINHVRCALRTNLQGLLIGHLKNLEMYRDGCCCADPSIRQDFCFIPVGEQIAG